LPASSLNAYLYGITWCVGAQAEAGHFYVVGKTNGMEAPRSPCVRYSSSLDGRGRPARAPPPALDYFLRLRFPMGKHLSP